MMNLSNSNRLFLDSDIPSFSSWQDGKGSYWLVIDKEHVWKEGKPTDIITRLCLCNVFTEKYSWMDIDTFNALLHKGSIYRTQPNIQS